MSNFQYLNIHVHFGPVEDKIEGLLPECSVSMKEAWSEVEATSTTDNDRQSTLLTSGKNFAQWLRTLQVGGMHKLMIKLSHVCTCVTRGATLTEQQIMANPASMCTLLAMT